MIGEKVPVTALTLLFSMMTKGPLVALQLAFVAGDSTRSSAAPVMLTVPLTISLSAALGLASIRSMPLLV